MPETLLRTPLYAKHVAAGARIVPFAGYEMPVQYASVIAEAKAVRSAAGMFDVSHMARLRIRGEDTLSFLERVTTNDVAKLTERRGQYSLLTNTEGGCIDDIILYKVEGDEFLMVVNASNHAKDLAWLNAVKSPGVRIQDQTDETVMLAVQGPKAVEILASLSDKPEELRNGSTFALIDVSLNGIPLLAARSGYTGEDGFELICAAADAEALWDLLVLNEVLPCGLASRDTLRVEAGLPLYGHELSDDLSPIAASLGWAISKEKNFLGSDKIRADRENGTAQKLVGVRLQSKRLLTPGMQIFVDGAPVGAVTSGVYSPLLECGIALGYVDRATASGVACDIDVRGKLEPGTIVGKRFYKRPA